MFNLKSVLGLALICCLSISLAAQDVDDKKKKKQNKNKNSTQTKLVNRVTNQILAGYKKAELSDEQTGKAKQIIVRQKEKLVAAQKAVASIFTADQRKARMQAMKKGKADGVKGQELAKQANKAAGIDDETVKKWRESRKQLQDLTRTIKQEINSLLTDEQLNAISKKDGAKKDAARKKKRDGAKKKKDKGGDDGGDGN